MRFLAPAVIAALLVLCGLLTYDRYRKPIREISRLDFPTAVLKIYSIGRPNCLLFTSQQVVMPGAENQAPVQFGFQCAKE